MDEAIKRLGHLSLAKTEANAAMQPPSSSAAATQPHAPPPGSTEEGNEGDPGPTQPASTSSSTRQEPRNPEEWVEGLVSEMAAATNMQDARWVSQHGWPLSASQRSPKRP